MRTPVVCKVQVGCTLTHQHSLLDLISLFDCVQEKCIGFTSAKTPKPRSHGWVICHCPGLIFSVIQFLFDLLFLFMHQRLSGEPWYLRQLLLHKPAVSFQDLRTIRDSDVTARRAIAATLQEQTALARRPEVLGHFPELSVVEAEVHIAFFLLA